jgi:hypothetical protein
VVSSSNFTSFLLHQRDSLMVKNSPRHHAWVLIVPGWRYRLAGLRRSGEITHPDVH